jgi:hypothetical protein
MAIVNDLIDEWSSLADARSPWESYWREVARYVLPHTAHFDTMWGKSVDMALNSVVSTPVAAKRSKDLYDMTSLWAIERLAAGLLSLKTPEAQTWHDLQSDSMFGDPNTHEEKVALERLRDYMFKVRSNPRSGFWTHHKAAIRSMVAYGDGWLFVEEIPGTSAKLPYRYQHMPITELYPGVDAAGVPNRMSRVFRWSALQCAQVFGRDKLPANVQRMVDDNTQMHKQVRVMHSVRPRDDGARIQIGMRGAPFASYYCFPDEKHLVSESGFNEFPFIRYAWNNSGNSPYSEGPIACALGEIRSLQEMAKNELIAVQTAVRPAFATAGKNFQRLNLNPNAVNPGLMSQEGRPLFSPIQTGVRPDFAQAVMEARRNSVRELLYLNLWQIIVQDKNDTATEALIKAQEKGELLGPVGISMNEGLSMMTDREVSILGRKGAFNDGSPLVMPDSMNDKDIAPVFTSPLDRLRRISEVIGMQRLVEFATMLSGGDPQKGAEIMGRFDVDEMLERAQEILGAPASVLVSRETAQQGREQGNQMAQTMQALEAIKQGGEAANAVGTGAQNLAAGAATASATPELGNMMQQLPEAATGAMAGAMG